jgi:hypothetical protein
MSAVLLVLEIQANLGQGSGDMGINQFSMLDFQ